VVAQVGLLLSGNIIAPVSVQSPSPPAPSGWDIRRRLNHRSRALLSFVCDVATWVGVDNMVALNAKP
jgi:hypothetical protein